MAGSSSYRWLTLAILVVLAVCAVAQTDTARLTGTIVDSQGAVVAAATITLSNLGTGRVLTSQSGASGEYTFNALPPGRYKVEVKSGSFKAVTQEITLQVTQAAALNFALQPGAASETVEVKSDVPLVESASSNISAVVVGRQIAELPLNGRNITQLATLIPGVTRGVPGGDATGAGNQAETFRYGDSGGAALSVNGLRPQANNFLLDGIDNNESLVNTIIFFPPAEAVEEFRVDTNVAPAEFGRAGGGVVNTTFKSGTNTWHGSAFEFLRNDNLDARRYFDRVQVDPTTGKVLNPKAEFKRNQFGGTLGGALIKNKLFIFGDYQGFRQFLPYEISRATVPTDNMRNGNFTELLKLPTPINVVNPITGQPFSTRNVIDPSLILAAGQNYLKAFPEPNISGSDPRCGLATVDSTTCIQYNYAFNRNQIQTFNDFDIRADYVVGSRDTVFTRFSYGNDKENTGTRLGTLPSGFGSGVQANYPRSIAAGETHAVGTSIVNEFRFGWVHTEYGYTPPFNSVPLSANFGIPNANTSTLLGGGALIGGGNGSHIEYTGDYGPYLVPQNSYQFSDTLSWVHGKHNIKFGASLIRRHLNLFRPKAGKGFFFFNEEGGPTGYEVSDMLAGFVNWYQVGPNFGTIKTRSWENGFFLHDDWRVTPRLTVNLGLRYDLFTWPVVDGNYQSNYDITTGELLLAGQNGAAESLINPDHNNFAPRIGFAYNLTGNGKTVLRGGYGVFYFLDRGGIDNQLAQNPPFSGINMVFFNDGYHINLAGRAPDNSLDPKAATADYLTSSLPKDKLNVDVNNPTGVQLLAALPNNRNSYVQQWNLQVQRELDTNTAFTLAYVGTKGTKLTTYYNANRPLYDHATLTKPYANRSDIWVQANMGNSIYHALQANLTHRMSKGLQLNASYTWSHTIDDSAGAFDQQNNRVDISNFGAERANSNLDLRHRFIFSALYQLPFGAGRTFGSTWTGVTNAVLGGWQVNPILTIQSGMPFDTQSNYASGYITRPDLVGDPFVAGPVTANPTCVAPTQLGTPGAVFNKCAFVNPPTIDGWYTRAGTMPRNFLIGPARRYMDFSIFKDFRVTERVTTQFRSEFFNITNTPQFSQPNGDLSSGDFGKTTTTILGTERQIQFALRVIF